MHSMSSLSTGNTVKTERHRHRNVKNTNYVLFNIDWKDLKTNFGQSVRFYSVQSAKLILFHFYEKCMGYLNVNVNLKIHRLIVEGICVYFIVKLLLEILQCDITVNQ